MLNEKRAMETENWTLESMIKPFTLGIISIVLLYWYSTRKHNYWKERGIPFVKPLPIFGSILGLFQKPLHEVEIDRYKKYGQIYGHFEGNNPLLSIGDPLLLKNIMVKDFHIFPGARDLSAGDPLMDKMLFMLKGEEWKRIRTIITPTFTTGKIKRMINIFTDCAATCVTNLSQYAESGKPLDIKNFCEAFTMDVIASSAFSTKIDSHNDPNNQFTAMAREMFTANMTFKFILFLLLPKVQRFFGVSLFPPKVVNFFKKVTMQIIEERKRTGKGRNDFLQMLMDTAKDEEDTQDTQENEDITANYGSEDVNEQIHKMITKKKLSYEEMIAQCIVFFLAGYESTATTISFATYQLALNPDVQEKMIAEIDEALSATDGKVTYEALQNMKTLDNVISETLRLYPPSTRSERLAEEDYKLGDTGITLERNMIVTIPICAIHRDPKYFPDPDKFDPERFNPEERAKREHLTFLPFGSGPRNCVAMRFALMEIKVCLAFIFSHFTAERCAETKVPLEFNIGRQLMQAKSVVVKMNTRKDNIKAH